MGDRLEKVLVTVSIDTECDHDPRWVRSNPLRFDSIGEGLPNRLQPLFGAVGAVPTYLLTVEVLEHPECMATLRDLQGRHELGTHLHPAFVEPDKKYHDYAGVDSLDFQCNYPPEIEYQKLANLTALFEQELGYTPTSFRAGRYGAGPSTIEALQRLGYLVDTSVTPHIRWTEPHGSVDFRGAPEQPYFPVSGSLRKAGPCGASQVLEVPITMRKRVWQRNPRWFRPWFSSVAEMQSIFDYHLRRYADQRVLCINMMFHSMEVIERASPYPQTPDDVQRYLADMHDTLQWCAERGAEFCGLSDLHEHFCGLDRAA